MEQKIWYITPKIFGKVFQSKKLKGIEKQIKKNKYNSKRRKSWVEAFWLKVISELNARRDKRLDKLELFKI